MTKMLPIREKEFPPFSQYSAALIDELQVKVGEETAKQKLKAFINHEAYTFSMAVLTIYSIFAIDIQKSSFGQASAYIFGYVHIIAILIFVVQMTLNSIGKDGYRCSFYFWIDAISTVSMVMEITWVDNYLTDNSNIPGVLTIAKVVKASRLSRIGSRAAKIIFIFLEYMKNKKREEEERIQIENKKLSEAAEQSIMRTELGGESKSKEEPEHALEEEENNLQAAVSVNQKLRFSKNSKNSKNGLQPISQEKMSEKSEAEDRAVVNEKNAVPHSKDSMQNNLYLFKRRSRLSFVDNSNANQKKRPERGKVFEIANIVERMQQTFKFPPLERPNVDPVRKEEVQRQWQQLLRREEQASKQSKQKLNSDKQNFKLGQTLKARIQKNVIIMIMSLIIILPLISADTWFNKDPTIDQLMDNYMALASSFNDSAVADEFLNELIDTANEGTYPVLELHLQTVNAMLSYPSAYFPAKSSQPPLSDFMQAEVINSVGSDYWLIFNGRSVSQTNALINIARSCFITVLLIFSTIIFMHSIESKALIPLEKMCISINKISVNPFDALKEVNESNEEQPANDVINKNDIETINLQRTIWKMTKILALGAGETGSQLISTKIDSLISQSNFSQFEGEKIHGVFLNIKISRFEQTCEIYKDQILPYLNQISSHLHEIVMSNGGIILDNNPPYFLFFWRTPQDIQETTKYYVANNPLKNLGKIIETQKIIMLVLRTYLQANVSLIDLSKRRMLQELESDYQSFLLQAGVHIGDGYRGSIGNRFKIEVKCIGSDVEFTKGLCDMCGQYGLSNLVSHQIYQIMDDHADANLRKADFVREKGWDDRFWLCTYDFTLIPLLRPEKYKKSRKQQQKTIDKLAKAITLNKDWRFVYKKRTEILSKIKSDSMQAVMPCTYVEKLCLRSFNQKFYDNWNQAIERFYNGEWEEALQIFESLNVNKGQSKDVLVSLFKGRIGQLGARPPVDWEKAVQLNMQC